MKVHVLAGDFTFIEPNLVRNNSIFLDSNSRHRVLTDNIPHKEGSYKAIINKVDEIFQIEEKDLDNFCENLLDNYEGYLIPELYNGEIKI